MPDRLRRSTASALAAALVLALLAAPAWAQDPSVVRAQQLVKELRDSRGGVLGLGPAAELLTLGSALSDTELGNLLRDATAARPHPLAVAMLEHERARLALDHGDRPTSTKLLQEQGFVLQWSMLGPIPNEGMGAFDQPFPPEQGLDPAQTAPGRHGAVGWVPFGDRHFLGQIDAEALIRPVDNAVIYLATLIEAPKAGRVVLRASASTPYRLWVNGTSVASVADDPGGSFDRDAWAVELAKGPNLVLVKLGNEEGEATFWLRVTDGAGKPLAGLRATDDLKKLPAKLPPAAVALTPPPLLLYLAEARKLDPKRAEPRARAIARAAVLARRLRPDDPGEPGLEFIREARTVAATPEVLLLAAESIPEQWRRKEAIDHAARLAPDDPSIGLLRARITWESAGDAHRVQALDAITKLLAKSPDFAAARLLEAELLLDEGAPHSALARADQVLKARPDHGRALSLALQSCTDAPLLGREGDLTARRLELNASNIGLYGPQASLLLQRGEYDKARAVVSRALAIRPDVTGFYGLVAEVERAAGDMRAAEAAMRRLVELAPGDATYWSRLGVFLLEVGDREQGVEAIQRSLALEPQNAELKQYLEHLSPDNAGLDDLYALPLPPWAPELDARYGSDDAVSLLEQKVTRVFNTGLASTFNQLAWRVRTPQGVDALRYYSITYTPGSEIVTIHRVRTTRRDGSTTDAYQSFEQSVSEPWYNLHYDVRAQIIAFPELAPGDTVEVQYTVSQTASTNIFGDYFGDVWYAQSNTPKLYARYVLLLPAGRSIVVREPKLKHTTASRDLTIHNDAVTERSWELRELPRFEQEESAPGISELSDYIHVSTFSDWSALSRWYWNLIKDQLVVDSELQKVVRDLTAGVTDRREIVARVHNWVVQNTRYVGLEFGIHGYKPYRTTLCFRRRFGDCKDKASLIKVMLDEAGVPANIVLVRTNRNGAIDPQPASLGVFDHAIAYVPELDLFLDGTAEYSGTAELPWGDQDVQVLVVRDGGDSTLRHTPLFPASENRFEASLQLDLSETGGRATGKSTVHGAFASSWRQRYGTPETRKEIYEKTLNQEFAGARVTRIEVSDVKQLERPVELTYTFEGARIGTLQGDTLRLLPALRPLRLTPRLAALPSRKRPAEIGFPFTVQESFAITLPPGFKAEKLPAPTHLTSPFGEFKMTVEPGAPEGGRETLRVAYSVQIQAHRIEPDQYSAFRQWLGSIDLTAETPLTFKKTR